MKTKQREDRQLEVLLRKKNDINPLDYQPRPMEVINMKHEEIYLKDKTRLNMRQLMIIFRSDNEISFPTFTARTLGLSKGLNVIFIDNGDDEWNFYIDNDPDGFSLVERTGKTGMFIFNTSLIHLFKKRTRFNPPVSFPVRQLKAKIDGKILFQIKLNPIQRGVEEY